jgi:hypothetical protein
MLTVKTGKKTGHASTAGRQAGLCGQATEHPLSRGGRLR